MTNIEYLTAMTSQVRRDIIRMVTNAGSGHPGGSLSSTDFVTALFFEVMKHSPSEWNRSGKNNDMFFLSAGHLAPLFYSVLARSGYFPLDDLGQLRRFGSKLQGHPSIDKHLSGVYIPSGSLGQGLSVACGAALGKKLKKDDRYVYVLIGDGESEEGQIWEAALFAAHHKIDNLIAMTDWNGQQIDGPVDNIMSLSDLKAKWESFGWLTFSADGHDMKEIVNIFDKARESSRKGKPIMILFRTEMGHGVDFMTGNHKWHGKAPSKEQEAVALAQLKETFGDFNL